MGGIREGYGNDMVTIKKIPPMPKPLCTKAIPKIMGGMRGF
jgi:hypothetical protein